MIVQRETSITTSPTLLYSYWPPYQSPNPLPSYFYEPPRIVLGGLLFIFSIAEGSSFVVFHCINCLLWHLKDKKKHRRLAILALINIILPPRIGNLFSMQHPLSRIYMITGSQIAKISGSHLKATPSTYGSTRRYILSTFFGQPNG